MQIHLSIHGPNKGGWHIRVRAVLQSGVLNADGLLVQAASESSLKNLKLAYAFPSVALEKFEECRVDSKKGFRKKIENK